MPIIYVIWGGLSRCAQPNPPHELHPLHLTVRVMVNSQAAAYVRHVLQAMCAPGGAAWGSALVGQVQDFVLRLRAHGYNDLEFEAGTQPSPAEPPVVSYSYEETCAHAPATEPQAFAIATDSSFDAGNSDGGVHAEVHQGWSEYRPPVETSRSHAPPQETAAAATQPPSSHAPVAAPDPAPPPAAELAPMPMNHNPPSTPSPEEKKSETPVATQQDTAASTKAAQPATQPAASTSPRRSFLGGISSVVSSNMPFRVAQATHVVGLPARVFSLL